MAEYKEMAQRWFGEVMSEGKLDVVDELCSPDYFDHDPLPGTGADVAGLKEGIVQTRAAFPDMQVTADDILVDGDRLAARSTMRATHEGDFLGLPATGKAVEVASYDIVRFEAGVVVEHWGVLDAAALMQQIGAVPAGA
jgi:predicted ester cyclase